MKLSALTLVCFLVAATHAHADEWHVNSTRDAIDIDPGDEVCSTGVTLPSGEAECTLRAAIHESDGQRLRFALPRGHTIYLPAGTYNLGLRSIDPAFEDGEQLVDRFSAADAAVSGDLDIDVDLRIIGDGPATTVIDGRDVDRVFHITRNAQVSLQHLTIQNGFTVDRHGAGVYSNDAHNSLFLTNVTIQNGIAVRGSGGGVYNLGFVQMSRVRLLNNAATRGGGLENNGTAWIDESTIDSNAARFDIPTEGDGGGIANLTTVGSVPRLELSNSTVSHNTARAGGGLLNRGSSLLTNVTITGNHAARGAGIAFDDSPVASARGTESLYIQYATIVENIASGPGGGISRTAGQPITLSHTLFTRNRENGTIRTNCHGGLGGPTDHNMENVDSCGLTGVGDRPNTVPSPGPLADNGGPTLTHALLPASSAIDAGAAVPAPSVAGRDQRGTPRPLGSATDIGAFEVGIDPTRLTLLVPVRISQLAAVPGVSIPWRVDLELHVSAAKPKPGSSVGAILSVKAGDAQGQLQYEVDKSGRKVSVSGVTIAAVPGDNPNEPKGDPVLFYVEVRRPMHGAAQLRFNSVTCECKLQLTTPKPIVIAPFKPGQM